MNFMQNLMENTFNRRRIMDINDLNCINRMSKIPQSSHVEIGNVEECPITIKKEEYEDTTVHMNTVNSDINNISHTGIEADDIKIKLDLGDANDLFNYTNKEPREQDESRVETSTLTSNERNHCDTIHGIEIYKCKICSRHFRTRELILKHVELHSEEKIQIYVDEKNYKCDVCNESLSTKHYTLEYVNARAEKPNYFCEICNKCFRSKLHLSAHVKTHAGERTYVCETCRKCFATKQHLLRHVKTHAGQRNYKCDFCEERFATKHLMIQHMKAHLRENNYKCEICNKLFATKYYMVEHAKAHARKGEVFTGALH